MAFPFSFIPVRFKIVWAKRVFPSLWNDSYKSILYYSVGLLCSDRVMFACNTGAKGACEECIKKKKRGEIRGEAELVGSKLNTQIKIMSG